jgi:hypothetical protein
MIPIPWRGARRAGWFNSPFSFDKSLTRRASENHPVRLGPATPPWEGNFKNDSPPVEGCPQGGVVSFPLLASINH